MANGWLGSEGQTAGCKLICTDPTSNRCADEHNRRRPTYQAQDVGPVATVQRLQEEVVGCTGTCGQCVRRALTWVFAPAGKCSRSHAKQQARQSRRCTGRGHKQQSSAARSKKAEPHAQIRRLACQDHARLALPHRPAPQTGTSSPTRRSTQGMLRWGLSTPNQHQRQHHAGLASTTTNAHTAAPARCCAGQRTHPPPPLARGYAPQRVQHPAVALVPRQRALALDLEQHLRVWVCGAGHFGT